MVCQISKEVAMPSVLILLEKKSQTFGMPSYLELVMFLSSFILFFILFLINLFTQFLVLIAL